MAPLPRPEIEVTTPARDHAPPPPPPTGEEVVISGICGKFPESPDMHTFCEKLYNKEDMVTGDSRRWELDHPEIPQRTGKIDTYSKFDAQFFGVHYKQAWTMEPMSRMLLENTYGAIFDAGINPRSLKNTKTGVFIGSSFSESEKTWFYEKVQVNGFGITGCSRAMYANRISYWLGTTAPSYCVDSACSSSLLALEHAYRAIRSGQCDAAIVGGVNLCLQPYVSLQFRRLGYLCMDGKTKTFDKNADGYARAESVGVLFLQKAKDAKRAYTEVAHVKTKMDGYQSLGPSKRSAECLQRFLNEFYGEISVMPRQIEFVEAYGAGMAEADGEELEAYDRVFCKEREGPVLVGSVKSNMGHSEPASGMNAVSKICLAYHKGSIAPNLHYDSPRDDVAGVREGRISIVTEPTPFSGGYTAASSYSFSGVNVHVLFKGYASRKHLGHLLRDNLPRLIVASGRSESAVKRIFNDVRSRPLDPEQVGLLHNIFESEITGHVFRGYDLVGMKDGETVSLSQNVDYFPGLKRPVWFVYSGMGSQWSGMGTELMRIPIFAAAVERCCQALAPKGVDLMRILTDPDPSVYDNILHSFVGIAAVQIGLTDVLTALGVRPDYIIGHSVGELGCAYADGCFTAEEMILAAYSRGLVSVQTPFIRGSMAAVGRGYQEMKSRCPPEIEIACHNGPDSCTISGPADIMKNFVAELTAEGVFAKEVPCSNIAYHSRYIAEAGPNLLKYLKEVIKEPKQRSPKWLSTSVPQINLNLESAQYSSAEYHTNNLLSSVLFEETSRQIPPNAITIEIAPHGLLQAILRRSLHADCINVPLTKRGHKDNVEFFLTAIGKLYEVGLNPQVAKLYPAVKFPVSVDTPMLSHLVEWEHSEDWYAPRFNFPDVNQSGEREYAMSICDEEHQFLAGHVINGTTLFPAAGYLVLVWETLGMMLGRHYTSLSVVFDDVKFYGDVPIHKNRTLQFNIMIHKGNGHFEVTVEGNKVAVGTITAKKSSLIVQHAMQELDVNPDDDVVMPEEDVYSILSIKGHDYSGALRSIHKSDISGRRAEVKWMNNWVTFLNSFMQLEAFGAGWSGVSKPQEIQRLSINVRKHRKMIDKLPEEQKPTLPFYSNSNSFWVCGGVEMVGFKAYRYTKTIEESVKIHKYEFVPYLNPYVVEFKEAIRTQIQFALQNITGDSFNVLEIVDSADDNLEPVVTEILKNSPQITKEYKVEVFNVNTPSKFATLTDTSEGKHANLVIVTAISEKKSAFDQLYESLQNDGFLVSRESRIPDEKQLGEKWNMISAHEYEGGNLILLKKRSLATTVQRKDSGIKYITIKSSSKFSWLQLVQAEWRTCERLVLISECDPCAGLLGMFNCLRQEPGGHALNLLLIEDYSAPAFRPDIPLYQQQLSKKLAINVYRNGEWGSYQYVPLPPVSVQSEHVYLANHHAEDTRTLTWLQGPLSLDIKLLDTSKKIVQVYCSAISEQDIQQVSGINHVEPDALRNVFGKEFSGRTISGERVMGLLAGGALSSLVEADVDFLWPVPPHWSMEDAATVPLAYATTYYCLNQFNKDLFGEVSSMTVLVHGGEDSLGQAFIRVCLTEGATVYTTVDSLQKKQFLLRLFPELEASHIGNSYDGSFEDKIMVGTKGYGCDLIINTLTERRHNVSLRCMAYGGIFMNLSIDDMKENSSLGMFMFGCNRNYSAASINNIFKQDNNSLKKKVQQLIASGIATGAVRPLSRVVLDASESSRAFRFTSSGHHVGKVLIQLRQEELRPLVTPSRTLLPAQPNYLCSGNGVYVVVSGARGDRSGLELADWLVQRGATNILLHTTTLVPSPYQAFRMRCWKRRGVKVQISTENLQTEGGCLQMLTDAAKQGPVFGLFVVPSASHCGQFEHAQTEQFARDFSEKALVAINLDSASRKLCSQLREFVVISSMAAGRGEAGCSSDALADSVMERVCEERAKLGLPALALQCHHSYDLNQNITSEMECTDVTLSSLDALLKTSSCIALVTKKPKSPKYSTVLEAIKDIFGSDFSNISLEHTLEELSAQKTTVEELRSTLEREFNIFCTYAKLLSSTLNELKSMDPNDTAGEDNSGLGIFFNYIDPEEFNAAEELVGMATAVSTGTETESEFKKKDKYVILVPSMEGHRHIFPTVAQRLKVKASSCQLGLDDIDETIPDIAARLSKVVLRKMEPGADFSLLGYGFGVAVALEMASILESHGHLGKVFCLDGSPRWFAALLEAQLGHLSERQLQDEVIVHMFRVMSASGSSGGRTDTNEEDELRHALAAESLWERKLDVCMRRLRGRVQFSFQYQRSLVAMAYARIRQARAYSDATLLSRPLRSELVLLKATRRPPSLCAVAEELNADLGLGAYSREPLRVYELDCDHARAPAHLSVSDIVNRHVADLAHFNKLNLCMQYIPETVAKIL